jgi:tetratricopeptide (TPR) repeat protein
MQLGRAYVSARRPDQAIRSLRSAVELNPLFAAAYVHLGDAYLQQRDRVSALTAFGRAAALNGGRDSAQIAYALAVTGHRSEAERLLGTLLAAPGHAYIPPIPVAKAYVGLGDVDAAFLWLERGYSEHAAQMRSVYVTPAFDALHADRRWALLMRRLGFEP